MKRILVSMLQEHGHLNPSFKVLRTLRARGWDVKYLGILDFEDHIRAQGFDFVPFLPDVYPKGFIQQTDQLDFLGARRAVTAQYEAVTAHLLDPHGPREQISALAPDVLLHDINHVTMGYLAWQLGVPAVSMNVTLPQTKDGSVPPLRSGTIFDDSLKGTLRSELEWTRFLAKRRLIAAATTPLGMCPPYDLARRAATRFGYPLDRLDCDTVYFPRLVGTPELVLCPDGFDFPRPPMADRHYVESIDLERTEASFPWERVDASKPLVYVSMGSQRFQPKHVRRFIQTAIDALGARPEWQGIVTLGRHLALDEVRHPSNVVVVKSAPQLAVLKRARVMVTHGGLGSVKECILHGVPMVVFPLAVDQPGNAARVEHHRLGRRGDIREVSQPSLLSMIDDVLGDAGYRTRLAAIQARFEATERGTRGADVVEETLSRHRPARGPSAA